MDCAYVNGNLGSVGVPSLFSIYNPISLAYFISFHSPSSLPPFLLLPSLYRNNPLTRLAFDADLFPLTRSALVAEDSLGSGDRPSLRKILPAHEIGPRCGKGVKLQGKMNSDDEDL
ncbi:hypothetical protein KFK09_011537 [Dendrobium nobile]|uniref:Uncharacterized protein n=1 Tax=Dendrobium nobile TaxID=94219 RepID=A0A8T3BD61_DENNO|nr:hypothetical protein KFK09_011537 [Dendrobium nobile]